MSAVVGWIMKATGISYWGLVATAVGAVILTVSGISLKIYEDGRKAAFAQQLADSRKEQKLLQDKADKAEKLYAKTKSDLDAYLVAHPVGAVQLCLSTPVQKPADQAQSRSASKRATDAAIQQMFKGDPGSGPGRAGPDIGPMLDAFGAAADQINNQRIELRNVLIPLAGKQ